MKVEHRANCCFISHSGLTVFADQFSNEIYRLKVTKRVHDIDGKEFWLTVGEMEVSKVDFRKWIDFLGVISQ
jgi:hypothetical protein